MNHRATSSQQPDPGIYTAQQESLANITNTAKTSGNYIKTLLYNHKVFTALLPVLYMTTTVIFSVRVNENCLQQQHQPPSKATQEALREARAWAAVL